MALTLTELVESGGMKISASDGRTADRVFVGAWDTIEDDLAALTPASVPPGPVRLGAAHPTKDWIVITNISVKPTNVVDGVRSARAEVHYGKESGLGSTYEGEEDEEAETAPDEGEIGFQSLSIDVSLSTQHPDLDLHDTQLEVPEELTAHFVNLNYSFTWVVESASDLEIGSLIWYPCCVNNRYWGSWPPYTWLYAGPRIYRNRKGNFETTVEFLCSFGITRTEEPAIRSWNTNQLGDGTDYWLYYTTNFNTLFTAARIGIAIPAPPSRWE